MAKIDLKKLANSLTYSQLYSVNSYITEYINSVQTNTRKPNNLVIDVEDKVLLDFINTQYPTEKYVVRLVNPNTNSRTMFLKRNAIDYTNSLSHAGIFTKKRAKQLAYLHVYEKPQVVKID